MINKNKIWAPFLLLGIIISFGLTTSASAADISNQWVKSVGGTGSDSALSTVIDSSGNTYTTGYFTNTADLDPSSKVRNVASKGAGDIYILKLNSNGGYLWARRIGGTGDEHANAITLDANGNIYMTGYFNGTVDFDSGDSVFNLSTTGNTAHAFVLKLNPNGQFIWAKNMGGNSWTVGNSIAVDANGNVYTKGVFAGTSDFDPSAATANLTAPGGQTYLDQVFISKLDSNGNYVWAKSLGANLWDTGYSLTLDSNANIYSTGYFEGTVDFDPGAGTANLTSAGSDEVYISKLDTNGDYVWAKQFAGTGSDVGMGVKLDSSNNVYTTGYFNGTVDFDPGAGTANLTSAGGKDVFVAKLDSNGDYVWAKNMGGSGDDQTMQNAIYIGTNGLVYTTGYFNGTADFNPGAGTANLTSAGGKDIFISKLDSSGNHVIAIGIGDTGNDTGNAISVDSSQNFYISGQFEGTVDFDPDATTRNLTSNGGIDAFVAKFQ